MLSSANFLGPPPTESNPPPPPPPTSKLQAVALPTGRRRPSACYSAGCFVSVRRGANCLQDHLPFFILLSLVLFLMVFSLSWTPSARRFADHSVRFRRSSIILSAGSILLNCLPSLFLSLSFTYFVFWCLLAFFVHSCSVLIYRCVYVVHVLRFVPNPTLEDSFFKRFNSASPDWSSENRKFQIE